MSFTTISFVVAIYIYLTSLLLPPRARLISFVHFVPKDRRKIRTPTRIQAVVNSRGEVTVRMSTSASRHLGKAMTELRRRRYDRRRCDETMITPDKANSGYLRLIPLPTSPLEGNIIACSDESSRSITKGPLDILFDNRHRGRRQEEDHGSLHFNATEKEEDDDDSTQSGTCAGSIGSSEVSSRPLLSVQGKTEDEVPFVFSESAENEANVSIFDNSTNADTCSEGGNTLASFDENDNSKTLPKGLCGTEISGQIPSPLKSPLRGTTAEEGVPCTLLNSCLVDHYANYCNGDSVEVPFDEPPCPQRLSLTQQRDLEGSALPSDSRKKSEVDLKSETLSLTKVVNQKKRLESVGLVKSAPDLIVINVSVQAESGVVRLQDQQKTHVVDLGNGITVKVLVGEEQQGVEGDPDSVAIAAWPKCDGSSKGENPTARRWILCGMECPFNYE